MRWLKAFKLDKPNPNSKPKRWLKMVEHSPSDASNNRVPYYHNYPYSYGSPYAGTSEDMYDSGAGDKIVMDPQKYIYK
jgi:hypothetical protein